MKNKLRRITLVLLLVVGVNILSPTLNVFATTVENTTEQSVKWDYRCDINNDLLIDQVDVEEVASRYRATPSSNNWNKKCDINNDGIVDIVDIVSVSKNVGLNVDPNEFISAKEIENRIPDSNVKKEFIYTINSDPELLEYYNSNQVQQQNIMYNETMSLSLNKINEVSDIVTNAGFFSTLAELNFQLKAIGMPVSLRYAFVAGGAGIYPAVLDGPLPIGDIISILIGVGVGAIIWYNWDYIEKNSDKILEVLKSVFYKVAYEIEDYFDDTLSILELYLSDVNSELSKEEEAVDHAGKKESKVRHIMTPDDDKHKWSRLFKDPKWNDVAPLLVKVLRDGEESIQAINSKGITYERVINYLGENVVVRFHKVIKFGEEFIRISTAFVEE